MNRIIAINLCGIVFQIDETAYDSLKKYLSDIRIHLGNSSSANEIYQDVENRIAELFQHKINSGAQAILPKDVNEVMEMMGQPEQFKEFTEENQQQNSSANSTEYTILNQQRRIYRNTDDKVLGGVCSGLAAYFGVDPVIIRLVFVALFFAGGFAFLIYIICWIAIPKASSPAEKMAMMGKPFTFYDVKKNVQREAQDVKQNFERLKYEYVQNRNYSSFTEILRTIFKIIAFAFLILGLMILVPIAVAMIAVFISAGFVVPFAISNFFVSNAHANIILLSIFAIVFIPIAAIIYKLIRLIFHTQQMHNWLKTALTLIWFGSIIFLLIVASEIARDFRVSSKLQADEISLNQKPYQLTIIDGENLFMKVHKKREHLIINGFQWNNDFKFDSLINANVNLKIKVSKDSLFHLAIVKSANGSSSEDAIKRASDIVYTPIQKDSVITFPHFFKKGNGQLWRNQHVDLTLQIPSNKPIHFTKDALDLMDEKFFQPQYEDWDDDQIIAHNWVMTSNGLRLEK